MDVVFARGGPLQTEGALERPNRLHLFATPRDVTVMPRLLGNAQGLQPEMSSGAEFIIGYVSLGKNGEQCIK